MCECGCVLGDTIYRLPIDVESCYVIRLRCGCRSCDGCPVVIVERIDATAAHWSEIQECPVLPLSPVYDWTEATILCGPLPYDFRKAAQEIAAKNFDDDIDEDLASDFADELWDELIVKSPKVLPYKKGTT